jgi:hypothetical protein
MSSEPQKRRKPENRGIECAWSLTSRFRAQCLSLVPRTFIKKFNGQIEE